MRENFVLHSLKFVKCKIIIKASYKNKEVIIMSFYTFIKSHKELNELPFMVVLRTLQVLQSMNMLKHLEGEKDVG